MKKDSTMKLIERSLYLNELLDLKQTPDIKVITGIRRSGKSRLMESLIQKLRENDAGINIIHINYNLTDFEHILEYHQLEVFVEDRYLPDRANYLFIDEVQMCPGFEKAINSLHAKGRFDIYISGSNAFLSSNDLATLFVGRTYEIQIFPFSFLEFACYFESDNYNALLTRYLMEGGMSGSYVYKNVNQKYRYIDLDVLNALVVRDIIHKYKIRNENVLHKLLEYLMDNIGNLTSSRIITESLQKNGIQVDHKTIARYITYLCKSFAFYRVRRYDVKGKKYLNTAEKYYLADHSFKYARLGTRNLDYGRTLENIVAIELMRRGYEVYVGVLHKKEIDFVAQKQGNRVYIQVAYDISEPKTFEREVASLLAIRDAYPKIIIARTYQPEYQYEGIRIIDAAEWLMPQVSPP